MARIKVDSGALKLKVSELNSQIGQLQALNGRLDQLINRIGDSWDGEASNAYIKMMTRYSAQAQKMIGIMNEFKSYAQRAAEEFDAQDKNGANRIRSGGGGW